jgi:hypothetical protein
MSHVHTLPPAQHVARREAARLLEQGSAFVDSWTVLIDKVVLPVNEALRAEGRLTPSEFRHFADLARATLEGVGPVSLSETFRGPTRARPKGEEYEFLGTVRYSGRQMGPRSPIGLMGLRVSLTRKRAALGYEIPTLSVTRHLLERSIERDLASWTGRLMEVEDALATNAGLSVVWRSAFANEMVDSFEFALPFGHGLLLGSFRLEVSDRLFGGISVGRNGTSTARNPPSPLLCPVHHEGRTMHLAGRCSTAVGEDLLNVNQLDLRDRLAAFKERHAELLATLGTLVAIRESRLTPLPSHEGMIPRVDAAAAELATILNLPRMREALVRKRDADPLPEDPAEEDAAPTGPGPA